MKYLDYWSYLSLSLAKLFLFSLLTASAFDVSFLFINLATILMMTSWALLVKPQTRRWILFASLFLHSTLLISDVWYYRYFGNLLSVALLSDIGQMGDVGGGFLTLIQAPDFIFFADLLVYAAVLVYMKRRPVTESIRFGRHLAVAGFLIGFFVFTVPTVVHYTEADNRKNPISNMREYYQFGFWGYHGLDTFRGLRDALNLGENLTEEERDQIESLATEPVDVPTDTNVIVVQLESFQTSVIGQTVNGQELTPNLNALRNEMLYFPNFYHQTHEGRTSDAEFTVNASLYPVQSGSVYTQYATNTFDALPEKLRRAGYDTAAMHAFDKEFWNRATFYEQIGYNHFFHQDDYPTEPVIGMAVGDKEFLTTSVDHLDTLDEPFYSFMVALTSHTPYEIPDDEKRLDLSGYDDPLLEDYYHTVHYSDAAVGLMVEQLKADEKWNNTLVVFYGDHDSGLTVAGGEMAVKADADSTIELFQLDRGVPLFIKPAGLERGQTVQTSGGQVDLAPTILDLLGMTPTYMLGRSLLDDEPNLTVFRNGSFRYDDLYFVPDLTKPVGSGTCYSVETGDVLPFQACEPYIDEAAEQLRLSDTIIEKDALSDFTLNDKQAAPK
ncbi:LTA synthase family protein [Exiguobacterium sp. AM39-5BH]|uniref:LTA synthase family protein n=1 Tax=Exiguobacterium sp. AM39-5BH TaxID=2292355 RepID=UPI000FE213EC|nr:LTA synthase family protein [Exiguobacterium sp. AM39-5BH]RHB49004.1 LTA synthase family protein [Exiguobacterium sp. AM39-5BH]